MSGSLILINSAEISTSVTEVDLTGIDSTYDVYMVIYANLTQVNGNTNINIRFLDSGGSVIDDSEYDSAQDNMCSDTSFRRINGQNNDKAFIHEAGGNDTNESASGTIHIFNASNASEYTHFTTDGAYTNSATNLRGGQGGGVLTSAEAVTGIRFLISSGNIDGGTFKLYGFKK